MKEEILTFHDYPQNTPLQIVCAGESFCDGSYFIARDGWTQAVLEFVISGYGTLTVNNETVHPVAGDVYLIPPMSRHHYASDAIHPWHKLWFNVDGPFVSTLLAAYGLSNVILLRQVPSMRETFEDGLNELRSRPEASGATSLRIIGGIVAELGEFEKRNSKRIYPSMDNYKDNVVNMNSFSLQKLCADSGCSPSQMIRIFRGRYGKTPYAMWLDNKLYQACMLLANTELSVKRVSLETGFQDPGYFSRLFRRKKGMPPLEYRKRNAVKIHGSRTGWVP